MIIRNCQFTSSAVNQKHYPKDGLPEVALAGRSNVGKSSLINTFLGRKNLAHTSSKPGKTQTLNFYQVNHHFYFVDVPGYGYARVSKKQRAAFGTMIQNYLETRANLKGLIIIIDGRHAPTKNDEAMFNYAQYLNLPLLIVATKIDKLKKSQQRQALSDIKREWSSSRVSVSFLAFSSKTKLHLRELRSWVQKII